MVVGKTVVVPLIVLAVGGALYASEEEFLVWNEVRIVSPKRDDTGQVVFVAKSDGVKYQEINIEAFGKKYALEKGDLARLTGFPLSSIVATHEAGYERLGGHMVHFRFKRTFYDPQEKLVEEQARISVTRGKGLSINTPPRAAAE